MELKEYEWNYWETGLGERGREVLGMRTGESTWEKIRRECVGGWMDGRKVGLGE